MGPGGNRSDLRTTHDVSDASDAHADMIDGDADASVRSPPSARGRYGHASSFGSLKGGNYGQFFPEPFLGSGNGFPNPTKLLQFSDFMDKSPSVQTVQNSSTVRDFSSGKFFAKSLSLSFLDSAPSELVNSGRLESAESTFPTRPPSAAGRLKTCEILAYFKAEGHRKIFAGPFLGPVRRLRIRSKRPDFWCRFDGSSYTTSKLARISAIKRVEIDLASKG